MGIADSPLHSRVLFLEGSPRSGTTWLSVLLATHPEIAGTAAESHLFDRGFSALFDAHDATGLKGYLSREQLVDRIRDFCDGVLLDMRAACKPAAPWVTENTPLGIDHDAVMARKVECYPDAWYVHLVRDSEAVVRSLQRTWFMEDRSREACEGLWRGAVTAIRQHAGVLDRYMELQYDDLRADPAAGAAEIFKWIGVDSSEQILEQVRRLSTERYAESGKAPVQADKARPRRPTARGAASALRSRLRRSTASTAQHAESGPAGWQLVMDLVSAAGHDRLESARELVTDEFRLEVRTGAGDLRAGDAEALEALRALSRLLFSPELITRSWTASEGETFSSVVFAGVKSDASRVDVAFHGVREGGRIKQLIGFAPGDPGGRPLQTWDWR